MLRSKLNTKKGDTLIEVVLSFVMFSLVAAISLAVMHAGISGAEASIELTLARVEIDAQSETMRFVQESYANDRSYASLWRAITGRALLGEKPDGNPSEEIPELSRINCSDLYDDNTDNLTTFNAFILNSRQINNGTDENQEDWLGYTLVTQPDTNFNSSYSKFSTSSLNPRVIYTTNSDSSSDEETTDDNLIAEDEYEYKYIYRAEGIYDFITKNASDDTAKPSHYDFYVYTCWLPPGADHPTTIGTVSRLYNPEYLNAY